MCREQAAINEGLYRKRMFTNSRRTWNVVARNGVFNVNINFYITNCFNNTGKKKKGSKPYQLELQHKRASV